MDRARSRSPERDQKRRSRMDRGGFRWKEKPKKEARANDEDQRTEKSEKRERRPKGDRQDDPVSKPPPREETKDDEQSGEGTGEGTGEGNAPPELNIASKFGAKAASKVKPIPKAPSSTSAGQSVAVSNSSKPKSAKAPTGPMMLVTVNDRLGTKKEVPCLGSDTIGDFKKLVAMQIGRKPHEIMLKRQSERALKDQLTLDDYEISSGVQLDLELNTGD